MDSETWRVVLESGEVRDVLVKREPHAWEARSASGAEGASGISARRAVQLLAGSPDWPVREILAPGELTRAEAIDAAVAEEREACARLAEWPDDDPDKFDGYHAADVAESVSVDIRARGNAASTVPA